MSDETNYWRLNPRVQTHRSAELLRLLVKREVDAASEETLELFDRLTAVYEELRENELQTKLLEAVSIPQVHISEMLRLLVKQRLHAASEETLGLIDRFTADYEEDVSRLRENEQRHKLLESVFNPRVQLHRSDVQQLLEIKAEVLPEYQEPLHIKEEKEDLWTRREGEQLNVLEEAHITKFILTAVTVKSEDDKPQTPCLHQGQTEDNREAESPAGRSATQIKTEADGEDCGRSGPARNLNTHSHSHPNADDGKASESSDTEVINGDRQEPLSDSGPESEDGDNVGKETRAPESAAHGLKCKEALVRHVRCNTDDKSFSFIMCPVLDLEHLGKVSSSCLVRNKCCRVNQKKESQPRVLTKEKTFNCDVCGKRFKVRGAVKRHMTVHTGEKPFCCDACGKRFQQKASLNRHMRVHTEEKPFACDVCGKRCRERRHLNSHMSVHTGEKPFCCDVCGKIFAQQGNMKKHMRVHTEEKAFGCDVCGKRFKVLGSLKRHMIVHTDAKPLCCNVCGKRFADGQRLKSHMIVHTGEKAFRCDVCGKRLTRLETLKGHMRVHTGEKPFSCDVCGKRFADGQRLKSHMRVHTEEKPFSCDVCGKRFVDQRNMKQHKRGHTG